MVKGFRQIALLTIFSRILGLVRDMAYSYFFGTTGLMDCWTIAFKIPNLSRRIFGEGAAASSFIPIYSSQLEKDPANAQKIACTAVTAISVILTAIVVLGEIVVATWYFFFSDYESTNLTLQLTAIMLPYTIFICVVAILAGILNSHRHFAAPAAAPILLNVFIISALVLSGIWAKEGSTQRVFITAIGVIIAGIAQLALQIPALRANGIRLRPAWQIHNEHFKKILFLMAPMIIGLTATQLNTLADDLIAKYFSGSAEKGEFLMWFSHHVKYPIWEGSVSKLYYAQRLYQFPLGVFGISLATAIFPVMSAQAGRKDYTSMLKTLSTGIKGAVFVALPATAGLILVGRPLVAVVFQQGQFTANATHETSYTLLFYSLGLIGFFSQQLLIRAFYSLGDAKIPSISACIAVAVNVVLNLTLIWFMGIAGLALSTAICSYLQVAILILMLRKKFSRPVLPGITPILVKTAVATVIMFLAGWLTLRLMANMPFSKKNDLLRLISTVVICAGTYLLLAKIMKNQMLSLIIHRKTPLNK